MYVCKYLQELCFYMTNIWPRLWYYVDKEKPGELDCQSSGWYPRIEWSAGSFFILKVIENYIWHDMYIVLVACFEMY